jgi:uncharacterized protein (DUF58 family)
MTVDTSQAGNWRPTAALSRALGCIAVLVALAVLFRRIDLLALAAPLIFGTVFGLLRRPYGTVNVSLATRAGSLLEAQRTDASVSVSAADYLDVVSIQLRSSSFIVGMDGEPQRCTSLLPGESHDVVLDLRATRWGRHPVGPAIVRAVGAHGLLRRGPFVAEPLRVTTLPLREGFEATDVVPRASGMVGPHRSRRPGEGTDIAGVRPFAVGDRLHRINWPVSLRAGELHVTSTLSDRDTDVVLVLDTQYDLGISEGIDGSSSSLDTAVRAAAAIAEHYLRHGDRVGLIDLGQAMRRVRPGGGRAHLVRLFDVLLDARPSRTGGITATMALGEVPPGALVLMLSPLVGESALARAASLGRGGHSALVVDTLPDGAKPPRRSEWTDVAWRVWRLEREVDIGRLAELGVPVVTWSGAGSLDEVLRDVSRAAGAPRALR